MARRSKATAKYREQINTHAPKRDTSKDGWIGDQAHAARKSGHNPNSAGVVRAEDITEDLPRDVDCRIIGEAIRRGRAPQALYYIHDGWMFSSYAAHGYGPFEWRRYTGSDAHTGHSHLSVQEEPALYDNASPWPIFRTVKPERRVLDRGDKGADVGQMQRRLLHHLPGSPVKVTDSFDVRITERWVKEFQARTGITSTGVVTVGTWGALDKPRAKRSVLNVGSRGEPVVALQWLLRFHALARIIGVSGKFDSSTGHAVEAFRDKHGLPVTTKVDAAVWRLLDGPLEA